eukprot:NODE_6282_length_517_cov_201.274892.p3 GENE.NODE_6282_length_517_cov_201.274892~~NODE_6282_length_517_cov_201.274892.p3  ORF type:complete len:109 (+),score=42.10 NODE_6282_length_517_cov_201.274892:3-329(+)
MGDGSTKVTLTTADGESTVFERHTVHEEQLTYTIEHYAPGAAFEPANISSVLHLRGHEGPPFRLEAWVEAHETRAPSKLGLVTAIVDKTIARAEAARAGASGAPEPTS